MKISYLHGGIIISNYKKIFWLFTLFQYTRYMKSFIQSICFAVIDIPSDAPMMSDEDFVNLIASDRWKKKCWSDSYWWVKCRMNNQMIDLLTKDIHGLYDIFYKDLYYIYEDMFLTNVIRKDYPSVDAVSRNNSRHRHTELLLTLN